MKAYLAGLNDMERRDVIGGNSDFGGASRLEIYAMVLKHEQELYKNLNALTFKGGNIFYGFAWSKYNTVGLQMQIVVKEMQLGELQLQDVREHGFEPPTYFRTNDFIAPFQNIVDTYGVPSYKEVNPAVFTIISFPFLFGVMFGDVGHGGILFAAGLFLCAMSDHALFQKGALRTARDLRYLISLLGFFSFFVGFMYNDFMSIPLEFGNSCYIHPLKQEWFGDKPERTFKHQDDCVYKAGVDFSWYMSHNELVYFNSMKMKIAVIFGVAQMCLGIVLKALNAVHFKKPVDFLFEFIPQLTLMLVLFGYMSLLIIVKWVTPWGDSSQAPSIISFMIDMFLKVGAVSGTSLIGGVEFNTRLNQVLLVIALLCVPTMLLVKPLWIRSMMSPHETEH